MFGILAAISAIYIGYALIKEKTEKPAPKGTRFDWDAYKKDIENGIGCMEQLRKQERGGYWTTKPLPEIVDIERYEYDKKRYGAETAECWKQKGYYRYKRKII